MKTLKFPETFMVITGCCDAETRRKGSPRAEQFGPWGGYTEPRTGISDTG
jgi:hypothetical protein